MATSNGYYAALHEGELLLDEMRRAGIKVWINHKTGSILMANVRGRPYFIEAVRQHAYDLRVALEREDQEK